MIEGDHDAAMHHWNANTVRKLLYIAQSAMSMHQIASADMVKMVAVWRDVCH